ncbi:RNA polymerase sigma factor [Dysgonomonas termitidis]|uniref:RNA polymerase sigma factor n=1 Tax=Dysgonomonas termitidis TaxID=1516126 RepID=A0ABV9KQZ1_9BACT
MSPPSVNKKDTLSDYWLSFVNGDKEAFADFYNQGYNILYSYGMGLGMDSQQVRDIIQDIFIRLYTNSDLINDLYTIKPFLLRSVRNAFLNIKKTENRHTDFEQINFELRYSIITDDIEDTEKQEHLKLRIKNILSVLTPRQKEIIYLRFIHQMDYEEISQIMSLSGQAARNLLHRAITKARENDNNKDLLILIILFIHIH